MSRHHIASSLRVVALFLATIAGCLALQATVDAATYYVSSSIGNDSNPGTQAQPFATLSKVSSVIQASDKVRLKRGDVWNATLTITKNSVEVDAYGTGNVPVIDGATNLKTKTWTSAGGNRWDATVGPPQVVQVYFNGTAGVQRASKAQVTAPNHWYLNGYTLTVYSTSNPSTAFASLDGSDKICLHVNNANFVTLKNIQVQRGGHHGILIQSSGSGTITDCSAYDCRGNGLYLYSGSTYWTITNGTFARNGTGIVAGTGSHFASVTGVTCRDSIYDSLGSGAGDGIQVSQDAAVADYQIQQSTCTGNAKAGVNLKIGNHVVSSCNLSSNGEPGLLVQQNVVLATVSNSTIRGNNTANNGCMNLAIEDTCEVRSSGNLYHAPTNGSNTNVNVNMTGACKFVSTCDYFVETSANTNCLGSIRANTGSNSAVLTVRHGSFYSAVADGHRVIDARGAMSLALTVQNCAFDAGATNLAYEDQINPIVNGNCYHNRTGGRIVEVNAATPRFYTAAQLALLQSTEGTDVNSIAGDPLFKLPTFDPPDLRPRNASPAWGAGLSLGITTDHDGDAFASPPAIGAEADSAGP